MKKGKTFEQLVHIIQEALKDHPATKVFPNIKLESKGTGRLRQFDVVIESSINGYKMRLAIECKNHGRKVEESLIEAFNSKCDSVGDIHRKIFISKSGYQIGALQAAKIFDIELGILEEISDDDVTGWIETKELYEYKFHFNITRHHLTLVGGEEDMPNSPMRPEDTVNFTDGKSSTLLDFYSRIINGENNEQRIQKLLFLSIPDLKLSGKLSEIHSVSLPTKLNSPYAYIHPNGKDLFISHIDLEIEVKIIEEKLEPNVLRLRNPVNNEIQATIISVPHGVDGSKIQTVIKPNGEFKEYLISPDDSIKSELQTIAIYDPVSKQYLLPK